MGDLVPVLAEIVERRRWTAGFVGFMDGHGQRRPDEQLLVLGQATAERLTSGDGLKRDLKRNAKVLLHFAVTVQRKDNQMQRWKYLARVENST